MLCTLDVLLEHHRAYHIDQQELANLIELMHNIHEQRYELAEFLSLWFAYPRPDYVGDLRMETMDIEKAIQSLEALCEDFCMLYSSYPLEWQEQILEQARRVTNTRRWSENLDDVFCEIPSGWIKPSWLPENAIYYSSYLHPVSLGIQTYQHDPENAEYVMSPFAWHTVCFDISKTQFSDYLKTLENAGIPYTFHDRDTFIQASVHFMEVDVLINWTEQETTLTLTGFDILS